MTSAVQIYPTNLVRNFRMTIFLENVLPGPIISAIGDGI